MAFITYSIRFDVLDQQQCIVKHELAGPQHHNESDDTTSMKVKYTSLMVFECSTIQSEMDQAAALSPC